MEVEYVGVMDPEAEAKSIHRLNRRCLKLTSVQLSSELVFPGISEVILIG